MSAKTYRLKVKKIPLTEDIVYKRPHFPAFQELHLDLLENKTKLKKNAPKPIFVRNDTPPPKEKEAKKSGDDEDYTLEELEKAYLGAESDNEDVFGVDEPEGTPHEPEYSGNGGGGNGGGEYQQQQFQQEQEEEEDEEEKERKEKADLLFKFMVLRRQYPNVEIPEFTEHSDMGTMKRVYEQVIRRVSLDSSVDNYKQYLVGGFMVLEWISTNWLGINLSGFTAQQTKAMSRYDRLLIELGEKNYSTMGSRFPVEVRLIFLIIFNAGLFYVQKMIFTGGDGGGANIMNAMFGGGAGTDAPRQTPAPGNRRRRGGVRGPTIRPEDVEELTRNQRGGGGGGDSDMDSDFDHDKED